MGLNQLVAYSEGSRRAALLNALNAAYSAGAVAGPILIAAFAGEHFSLLYFVAAAVSLYAASIGAVAPWAYIVTGLAIAPIFPTGIVWLAKLRPGDSRATAWLYPAASLGGIVGPGAIGLVVAGVGVGSAPIVLGVVATGMLLAFWLANRLA